MARIRTIKPSFWTDEKVATLTPEEALLFIGLWNEADDEGRLLDIPKRIEGAIFSLREASVSTHCILTAIENAGLIVRYESGGTRLIQVVGFLKHQRINRPTASLWDGPPDSLTSEPTQFNEDSLSTHGGLTAKLVQEVELGSGSGSGSGSGIRKGKKALALESTALLRQKRSHTISTNQTETLSDEEAAKRIRQNGAIR